MAVSLLRGALAFALLCSWENYPFSSQHPGSDLTVSGPWGRTRLRSELAMHVQEKGLPWLGAGGLGLVICGPVTTFSLASLVDLRGPGLGSVQLCKAVLIVFNCL